MNYNTASSGHSRVTETAIEILNAGGNAFDAAIGATVASTLCEPMLGSLGGGGFAMIQTAKKQRHLLDFFVNFPGIGRKNLDYELEPLEVQFGSAKQTFYIGPSSICPPGVLKGLLFIHKHFGKMPLRDILAPSITMARQGVVIDDIQAYVIRILYPIMVQSQKGRDLFLQNNKLIDSGKKFYNPDFANFLEELPQDLGRSIYTGQTSADFVREMGSSSLITTEDFRKYEVIERSPLEIRHASAAIFTNPEPSMGGVLIKRLLDEMSNIKPASGYGSWGSPSHLKVLSKAMHTVEKDYNLTQTNKFTKGTTHLNVSDKAGNIIALSMSNGQGAGYFLPGTGIMMNNMLGEDDLVDSKNSEIYPGTRIPSMMAPTILHKGENIFAIGSGGSKRIRSSIMQVISNLTDFNLSLKDAVLKPRINWDGELLQIEKGLTTESLAELKAHYPISEWPGLAFYFGGTHSVSLQGESQGDIRRGGFGLTGQ